RLNEPKYATSVGVFWTGGKDTSDNWSPTPHVLVAGGIIALGDPGQYTSTATVDILREEGVDPVSGKVSVTALPVQWIPNPPRFEMATCCFKHSCVLAGGRTSLGDIYHSDRADVWDG
ncbi:unnamed protein product, partial [Choristocarpus tenellus]